MFPLHQEHVKSAFMSVYLTLLLTTMYWTTQYRGTLINYVSLHFTYFTTSFLSQGVHVAAVVRGVLRPGLVSEPLLQRRYAHVYVYWDVHYSLLTL